jgi:hypothetical protein
MPPSKYPYERAHYRLAYPERERPRLLLPDDTEVEVVCCSEGGLRFRAPDGPLPEPGARVRGTLHFQHGAAEEVEGIVVRVQKGEVAVHLTGRGIPFSRMWMEQRWMRGRYPDRFVS